MSTTRYPGYAVSQIVRKLIEIIFGDGKRHGTLRQLKLRGLDRAELVFAMTMTAVNCADAKTFRGKWVIDVRGVSAVRCNRPETTSQSSTEPWAISETPRPHSNKSFSRCAGVQIE
ncbi:MAG: hypothetical protein IPG28_20345 [Betaproteobacteria bacterium]|nr:hypothetical protein [Betaproteobacteria bacterium]